MLWAVSYFISSLQTNGTKTKLGNGLLKVFLTAFVILHGKPINP
jgi:hypothetical protein